jgi:hypothetical protein
LLERPEETFQSQATKPKAQIQMKLASLRHGRDGRLVVVSRDLKTGADAAAVAPTLQAALDNWKAAEPRLSEIAAALKAELAKYQRPNGIVMDSSSWKVSARNPG